MSRHNKKRRGWKCGKCHMPMWQELQQATARIAEATTERRVVHVCGQCKAMHYDEAGKLRLLTAAELFALNMRAPEAIARIERMRFKPSDQPEATVVISREEAP